jgi:hypothetical protein
LCDRKPGLRLPHEISSLGTILDKRRFCPGLKFLLLVPICPDKGVRALKQTLRPSRLTRLTRVIARATSPVTVRSRGYRCLACIVLTSLFLLANAASGWGQLNARTASVTLVATLESLSVAATSRDGLEFSTNGMQGARLFPLTITTTWAVPSNLTTVKVTYDGITVFTQKAGETNRVARRIDNIDLALPSDRTERQTDGLLRGVVRILVQAL